MNPVALGATLGAVVPSVSHPEARGGGADTLFDRVWSLIRERHIFIADFWNSATASNRCLAGGRAGGYLHINWNGDVAPCVFLPYAPKNVNEVFESGGRWTTSGPTPSSPTSGSGSGTTATGRPTSRAMGSAGTSRPTPNSPFSGDARRWALCLDQPWPVVLHRSGARSREENR